MPPAACAPSVQAPVQVPEPLPPPQPPLCVSLPVCVRLRRQLEERCRDMDIHDLQPFFQSAAFREAGFRLGGDGQQVLLARS